MIKLVEFKNSTQKVLTKANELLTKFFVSDWYIALFSAIVLLSWYTKLEVIAVSFAVASLIYMFLTQKSADRLILVAIVIPAMANEGIINRLSTAKFVILGILVAILIGCGVYFYIKNRNFYDRKIKNSQFAFGYVLVVVALAFAGLGYEHQTFLKALITLGIGAGLLALYVLLYKCTNAKAYSVVAKAIVALGVISVLQMLIYFLNEPNVADAIMLKSMNLGWAITNAVAFVLTIAIPMCFYLACKSRVQIGYMLLGLVMLLMVFLTNCRTMMVVSIPIFVFSLIFSFFKCNKGIALANLLITASVICVFVYGLSDKVFSQFIRLGVDDNGRVELWTLYFSQFKTNMAFGMGYFTDVFYQPDHIVRAHNSYLQILACTGIIGTVLCVPCYIQRYKAFLVKINWFKVFAFLSYGAFVGYGLLDCAMASTYKIITVILLMLAVELNTIKEKEMENKKEKTVKQVKRANMQEVKQLTDKQLTSKHKIYRCFFKRVFDVVLSGFAMLVLLPVYAIMFILVRAKLGKPAVFKQTRPGYKNKIFMFYKYRSMADLRDENGELLPDEVRMTKFGKLMRKTSLDELPQLWNIFKGDMSFVGPRPKLIKDMVFYNDVQNKRSLVRPGLTGYAQANGRNLNSWEDTFALDLYYVQNCSLWLDIKILFKTALKVIKKEQILTQDQVPDAYYYGDHLLQHNEITEEEYNSKIGFAKELENKALGKAVATSHKIKQEDSQAVEQQNQEELQSTAQASK